MGRRRSIGKRQVMHIPRVKLDPKNIDLGADMDGPMQKPYPLGNPWLKLGEKAPYVLEIDRKSIECYNADKAENSNHCIDTSLIPEPFIGNPHSAKLVLLSLNPGRDDNDAEGHADPDFRSAMFSNLRHIPQQHPFYPLNPEFRWTPCGKWWAKLTRALTEGLDLDLVTERLLVIEWFPYHSKKSGLPHERFLCESQRYSCHIAQEMREKGTLMVLLRSPQHWAVCDKGFSKLPLPHSRQNPVLTAKNFGDDLFKQMRVALS